MKRKLKNKLDFEPVQRPVMEMCNFQITKEDHAALKAFLKKKNMRKCEFFRAVVQTIKAL